MQQSLLHTELRMSPRAPTPPHPHLQPGSYSEHRALSRPPKTEAICCLASLQSGHRRHVSRPLSFLPLPSLSWDNLPPTPSTAHKSPFCPLSLRPVSPWRLAPSGLGGLLCITPAPWLPGCLESCPVTPTPATPHLPLWLPSCELKSDVLCVFFHCPCQHEHGSAAPGTHDLHQHLSPVLQGSHNQSP